MSPVREGAWTGLLILLLVMTPALAVSFASCGIADRYVPPVMDAAIRHFREVLAAEHVPSERLKCEVEVHQSTALMLCEAKLGSGL